MDIEGKERRDRGRIRARVSVKGEVNEQVDARIRLATGGDNPVSTNQTLDEGLTKDIGLDQAYVDFHPGDGDLNLWAGKMANPFMRVDDLIWDGDLNPEGLARSTSARASVWDLAGQRGGFIVDERKSDSDAFLYGAQLGGGHGTARGASRPPAWPIICTITWRDSNWSGTPMTAWATAWLKWRMRRKVTSLRYREEFGELELFRSLTSPLGLPVSLYTDFVVNTEAAREETAYMLGLRSTARRHPVPGNWTITGGIWKRNSVVGLFTDSDSFGRWNQCPGASISGEVSVSLNWQLGSTLFLSKLILRVKIGTSRGSLRIWCSNSNRGCVVLSSDPDGEDSRRDRRGRRGVLGGGKGTPSIGAVFNNCLGQLNRYN